jgi:hypothetical protein
MVPAAAGAGVALALAGTCTAGTRTGAAVGVPVTDAVPVAASSKDGRVAEPVVWDGVDAAGDAGAAEVLVAVLALPGPGVEGGAETD